MSEMDRAATLAALRARVSRLEGTRLVQEDRDRYVQRPFTRM
jgi:hypothetical protein